MAIADFIEVKEPKAEKKYSQVELTAAEFTAFKKALDEDGLTVQQILKAGVVQYMSERKKKG